MTAIPAAARRRLAEMAGAFPGCSRVPMTCAYCGGIAGYASWLILSRTGKPGLWISFGGDIDVDIDHIFPLEHGGPNTLTNLAISCTRCNRSKGHKQICEWRRCNSSNDPLLVRRISPSSFATHSGASRAPADRIGADRSGSDLLQGKRSEQASRSDTCRLRARDFLPGRRA